MPDDVQSGPQPGGPPAAAQAVDDFALGAFPANAPADLKAVLGRRLEGLRPDALVHLPLPARQRSLVEQVVRPPARRYGPADAETRRKRVESTSYRIGDALVDAVHVALLLRQPLLLTGEPGVGKTAFAEALAARLGLPLETVSVKSTTTGRDLLYEFDEVGRFRNASETRKRGLRDFVSLRGLGLAIARGLGHDHVVTVRRSSADVFGDLESARVAASGADTFSITLGALFPKAFPGRPAEPAGETAVGPTGQGDPAVDQGTIMVVLLDEFDKAVRDTPNDLLLELERLSIDIREIDVTLDLSVKPWNWPIVVVTTNDERSLPAPFLRRCVHHHMTLPDDALVEILIGKLPLAARAPHDEARAANLARAMNAIKKTIDSGMNLSRRPGTAEYIGAFFLLMDQGVDADVQSGRRFTLPSVGPTPSTLLEQVCAVLAKTPEDKSALSAVLGKWIVSASPP